MGQQLFPVELTNTTSKFPNTFPRYDKQISELMVATQIIHIFLIWEKSSVPTQEKSCHFFKGHRWQHQNFAPSKKLISGRQLYSRAEMCSEPNRKYVRPEVNNRNIQIQEWETRRRKLLNSLQWLICQSCPWPPPVSLLGHQRHPKCILIHLLEKLFHKRQINLNKAHVFLPERHLAVPVGVSEIFSF